MSFISNFMRVAIAVILVGGSTQALAQAPILWYDFADGTNPTANLGTLGSTFDGELLSDATLVTFDGGTGVEMFGTEDHVIPTAATDLSPLNIADQDFSIEVSFATSNEEPGVTAVRFLVTKQAVGVEPAYGLAVGRGDGRGVLYLCDGVDCVAVQTLGTVNDGSPHRLLGVREGGFLRIYLDSVLEGVACIPDGFGSVDNDAPFVVGGRTENVGGASPTSGPFDDFIGTIGEIEIHDYAVIVVPPASGGFLRGDCNIDGSMNVADAVFGLAALFTGGGPLRCEDACDINDDGAVDIADMVFALEALFVGGPAPNAPFVACGDDPTDDDLCCETFAACP